MVQKRRRRLNGSLVPQALRRKPDSHASRDPDPPGRKLNVREAARFVGLSASTLNKLRLSGNGPPYMKLGRRVLYDLRDLETWAVERKRHHTSQPETSKTAQNGRSAPVQLIAKLASNGQEGIDHENQDQSSH